MRISIPDRLRRYGFALLILALGWWVMAIPVIREGAGTSIIVYFFAILLSAWYGGLGPGLFATAVIVWMTSHAYWPLWRLVRLALGLVGGVAISALAESLHAARRRAEAVAATARRHEERLRHSEGRLQAILENSPTVVYLKGLDGRYLLVNRRFEDVIGLPREQVVGKTDHEIIPAEVADAVRANDRRVLDAGTAMEFEEEIPLPDGVHTYISTKFPLLDETGAPYAICGKSIDVTDRRRAERALHAAKEGAEEANRSKDRFLAMLSHELRTPLTPVLATVTALLDEHGPEAPAEIRPTLELIRRSIELEARLIDDLLDVNRVVHGKLTLDRAAVDVHALVHQTMGICRSDLYGKGLRLELRLDAPAHTVEGDPTRLQQVLWNLIKNAVKFTPDGGTLAIATRNEAGPGSGRRLVVAVSDTGVGIAPEALARIFEPFEQGVGGGASGGAAGGLGLGLAISRSVVEAHGGRLTAESAGPGRGSTFVVTLEAATTAVASARGPESTARAATTEALRILLVEDDPPSLRVLARLLQQRRHAVTTADSVAAALEVGGCQDFDLLISDIGLPDGTGLDLLRQLRDRRPVRAIALSGYGMEEDLRRSREAGFAAHLTKPVDFAKLEAAIRNAVAPAVDRLRGPATRSSA